MSPGYLNITDDLRGGRLSQRSQFYRESRTLLHVVDFVLCGVFDLQDGFELLLLLRVAAS